METLVNYNGILQAAQVAFLPVDNRGFRYGDGFFETIRCREGKPLWLDQHWQRMEHSARVLQMDLPANLDKESLNQSICDLLRFNDHLQGARVRLSLFRQGKGFYRPEENTCSYLIESSPLDQNLYELNRQGLLVGIYSDVFKPYNKLSGLKTANALLYVMAARHACSKGWDDGFILNENTCLAEATSSNIFVVDKGKIFTPSADQACVEGVMRRVLMQLACKEGFKVSECTLTPSDLLEVDEVFLTNTIRGIQWVKGFGNKRYYNDTARKLINLLNVHAAE